MMFNREIGSFNLIDLVISFMNIIYLTFQNENENLLDTFYLKLMYHFSDKYKVRIILQKFIFSSDTSRF